MCPISCVSFKYKQTFFCSNSYCCNSIINALYHYKTGGLQNLLFSFVSTCQLCTLIKQEVYKTSNNINIRTLVSAWCIRLGIQPHYSVAKSTAQLYLIINSNSFYCKHIQSIFLRISIATTLI